MVLAPVYFLFSFVPSFFLVLTATISLWPCTFCEFDLITLTFWFWCALITRVHITTAELSWLLFSQSVEHVLRRAQVRSNFGIIHKTSKKETLNLIRCVKMQLAVLFFYPHQNSFCLWKHWAPLFMANLFSQETPLVASVCRTTFIWKAVSLAAVLLIWGSTWLSICWHHSCFSSFWLQVS